MPPVHVKIRIVVTQNQNHHICLSMAMRRQPNDGRKFVYYASRGFFVIVFALAALHNGAYFSNKLDDNVAPHGGE